MLRVGHLDRSAARRKAVPSGGSVIHKTPIIGPLAGETEAPTGFLVEQPPDVTIRPHFHFNCQFQVFVAGEGRLGRHPVRPLIVQYVGAHTGYGPIVAGTAAPLWYLTLRPSVTSGAHYLPDERDRLDMTIPKRQVMSPPFDVGGPLDETRVDACLAPAVDGLAAWTVRLPPRRRIDAPRHPGGVGRYLLVAAGEMRVSDERLGPLGLAWATQDDESVPLEAGDAGLEAIVMQFPTGAF